MSKLFKSKQLEVREKLLILWQQETLSEHLPTVLSLHYFYLSVFNSVLFLIFFFFFEDWLIDSFGDSSITYNAGNPTPYACAKNLPALTSELKSLAFRSTDGLNNFIAWRPTQKNILLSDKESEKSAHE